MKKTAEKLKNFIKKEIVLCLSAFLALISMFFIRPDASYLSYIDFRTLAILFCLMTIVAGFRQLASLTSWLSGCFKKEKTFMVSWLSSCCFVFSCPC